MYGRQSFHSPVRTPSDLAIPILKIGKHSSTPPSPTSLRVTRSIQTIFVGTLPCTKKRSTSMFTWSSSLRTPAKVTSLVKASATSNQHWSTQFIVMIVCIFMSRKTGNEICFSKKQNHKCPFSSSRWQPARCKAISWSC